MILLFPQHPEVQKGKDGPGKYAKTLTITDKLMIGKHAVDVQIKSIERSEAVPKGEATGLLVKDYEEEQQKLEDEIQLKKGRVVELQAKIQTLKTTLQYVVNDPASDATDDPAEISQSHV
ncbi:hypothetical protein LIER_03407 [Lithospermum erythrorhizon]|uniref:Uncharacterized protein n=1 Tax=Lithospermum erythrorhizon TaxID=34254 RepID=A0AAV3NXS9_LITER